MGVPWLAGYAAVKAATVSMCKSLALDVARRGIRVNCVSPGDIKFPGGSWERIEEEQTEAVLIKMNEPMRTQGYTFFQASWGPQDARPGDKLFSVFEVVKNPADKWPEYSLYVVAVGLCGHFLATLTLFIIKQFSKNV